MKMILILVLTLTAGAASAREAGELNSSFNTKAEVRQLIKNDEKVGEMLSMLADVIKRQQSELDALKLEIELLRLEQAPEVQESIRDAVLKKKGI